MSDAGDVMAHDDFSLTDEEVDAALADLRAEWAGLYVISRSITDGWWAMRHDATGEALKAPTVGALGALIAEDDRAYRGTAGDGGARS